MVANANTIPASAFVEVIPGVVGAGGAALDLIGLMLDNGTRVPVGQVLSFPTQPAVAAYFGTASHQAAVASRYFLGFVDSDALPGAQLWTQYNPTSVAAWIRGGRLGLTLAQLQNLSGSLDVLIDGYAHDASSIVLSSATSFSNAASLIQTGINGSLSSAASGSASSIAPETASVTASISGVVMDVSAVGSGTLYPGSVLSGTGVTSGTIVDEQLTGTAGGVGTYVVSIAQTTPSTTVTAAYGLLTAGGTLTGSFAVGQTLTGSGVTGGTQITALDSGTGGAGTYVVNPSQTVAGPEAITANPTNAVVTYDSTSGAFVITSGVLGSASTVAFATGTLSAGIMLTQATGAVLSQGALPATPGPFMDEITQVTQNWASFMTTFDPDFGSGNAEKLQFVEWTNDQDDRYVYSCWDTDITPTEEVPAETSLGYLIQQAGYSGTCLSYEPSDLYISAFVCGAIASVNFQELNGRVTFAYRSQTGLVPGVTNETVAFNLGGDPQSIGDYGNGYNYYAAAATANQAFQFFQRGSVSGPFLWLDSYINQIWLNNALQLAILEGLTAVKSAPYNPYGYSLVDAWCMDPITAALNFGAIRTGVPLSAAQIAEVNAAAGTPIDSVLSTRGWYLQVLPATAQVRAARSSPPCTLWYMDGQAIQAITLNSLEVE